MKSKLLISVMMVLLTLTAAFAKSYDIELRAPRKVGKQQLKSGRYSFSVKGDTATFRDEQNKSYSVSVKIENGTQKFKETMVDTSADQIRYIQLGGSTTTVAFIE